MAGANADEFAKNLCTALNLPADRYVHTFACTWQNMGYVSGFVRRVKTSAGYNGMFKLSMSSASDSKEYSFWSWDSVTFYANQIPTRAEFNTLNSSQSTVSVTNYVKANDYRVRICRIGHMVSVSGYIYGTGSTGYIQDIPLPFMYNDGTVPQAIIFQARDQSTGAIVTLRCGGSFYIYRESSLASGNIYSFAFSYCDNA